MSELTNGNQTGNGLKKYLLTTVSAFALAVYVGSNGFARAEDAERPTVWIELGGQMESAQGTTSSFTAPFMSAISPTPGPYANNIFVDAQRPARLAFGLQGAATFQPKGSDWLFSVNLRYGRSSTNRHLHQQSARPTHPYVVGGIVHDAPFADGKSAYDESHAILDFDVGKDVGLGAFGHEGSSTINAGVRFAQVSDRSNTTGRGRPTIHFAKVGNHYATTFNNYTMFAQATRSFRGVGPSLSWDASAVLLGTKEEGNLSLDWEINGAVLFGRQKAKTSHTTQAYDRPNTQAYGGIYDNYYYTRLYAPRPHAYSRSRTVAIPNLGGFAGFSVRYPNAKFSLGYRADFFFGAMDTGIDARSTSIVGFHGPFATISIGLGG